MMSWQRIGDVAALAQLTGLDSVKIIALIVKSASNARMHKKNCQQFANHLKLIGNLLQQLKLSELKEWPETREPLEQLDEALRRAFVLVNSCQDKSYLYLLALGWNTVCQFKQCQADIDRLLHLIPLITLVDQNRERLRQIEKDKKEYTLDEEELKVHETVLKSDVTEKDARVLEKSLSRSYPGLSLEEVLDRENKKLRMELEKMEECMELDQCEVIHHLLDVTENTLPQKLACKQSDSKSHISQNMKRISEDEEHDSDQNASSPHSEADGGSIDKSRLDAASSPLKHKVSSNSYSLRSGRWQNSLYDCCMDPYLCISTFMYPCGTFANIAAVISDGKISQEDACNDLMTYSLVCGCCCYTCCIRRKVRKHFGIHGDACDDFCTHVCCFCCALVQEWREILVRESVPVPKFSPPSEQRMERD